MSCNLSYIIATRNRLPFLKITLEKLVNNILQDEEIIVIDGNSSDGTPKYLAQLYNNKKIQLYVSEPDQNQAHGWNKALLLARGKIIKKIIDDDVFSLTTIRKCKDWMLDHPETAICISNTLQTDLLNSNKISKTGRLKFYLQWQAKKTACFTFSDVYMLIRKDALSFTGLYDTQFRMMDWEFSLRCSFLQVKIAYYTGYNSLTVHTPGNVTSLSTPKTLRNEARIAKVKYGYAGDQAEVSLWSELKIFIGTMLHQLQQNASFIDKKTKNILPSEIELAMIYKKLYQILEQENLAGDFSFIC